MLKALNELDRLLRGESTRPGALRDGEIEIPILLLSLVILLLALLYGACMGTYSLFKEFDTAVVTSGSRYWQLVASTVKVPLLFALTLLVTFPSLYVFNALVGSRLHVRSVFQLLIASLGVTLAVLASLGPIVAFFSISTKSYSFMVLFNVLLFGVSGTLGMMFLLQSLNRLSLRGLGSNASASDQPERSDSASENTAETPNAGVDGSQDDESQEAHADAGKPQEPGALDAIEGHVLGKHVKVVFRCWMIVFGLVGAQMSWVLRPFIGNPSEPFEWFRERESNFFESVIHTALQLLTGS